MENGGRPLPKGWRRAQLSEIVAEAEAGFACGQRAAAGVVQLRMNNVDTRGNFIWEDFIRVPADPPIVARYRLESGDILFNNTNSVDLVGKTALFAGHSETVLYSNHFTRIRVAPAVADPAFVSAWLLSQWQARTFAKICNRWIGQSAVKNDKLLALQIPLPPLPEQRRIAAILNEQMAAVERARAAAEAQLEAAKALPSAYLRAVFDSPEAQHWPRVCLADLLVKPLKTGISKPARQDSPVHCLTLSAVRNGILDLSAVKPVDVSESEAQGNWLQPGAFYIVRGNGNRSLVGRGALAPTVIPRPTLYPDLLIEVVTDLALISTGYLRFIWNSESVRRDIEGRARTSAGIHKINQENLGQVLLPLPSLRVQQGLSETLEERMASAERARNAVTQELETINKVPAALLRQAFNGEL